MRKIVLLSFLTIATVFGDVTKLVPYYGYMSYSQDINSSIKDNTTLGGIYASVGDLSYLIEANYAYVQTQYKRELGFEDLFQHDMTLTYAKYFKNFMYKFGGHYIYTNDIVLGNGAVVIASVGGYNFLGYDKLSYGVNGYYSFYLNGRNEENFSFTDSQTISVMQVTPYLSYFHSMGLYMSNLLSFELHYQYAPDYLQQTYLSYGVSDRFYYKKLYLELSAYNGQMRSGVKRGGVAVINSLDLQKYGASLSLGYFFNSSVVMSASYSKNVFLEYAQTQDGSNAIYLATLSYRF